jgi:hypothetical protein
MAKAAAATMPVNNIGWRICFENLSVMVFSCVCVAARPYDKRDHNLGARLIVH